MHILYGFSNCTDKKYNELMSGKNISILRPDQKYHGLLIKGLAANGADVKCFSGLPVNRALTKKIFINEKDETKDSVFFHEQLRPCLPEPVDALFDIPHHKHPGNAVRSRRDRR